MPLLQLQGRRSASLWWALAMAHGIPCKPLMTTFLSAPLTIFSLWSSTWYRACWHKGSLLPLWKLTLRCMRSW
ncbi:unnamed protein product, partial [Symbiodinium sp. KB8]